MAVEESRQVDPKIVQGDIYKFRWFARMPEYREENRNLLRRFVEQLPQDFVHIDIASGSGLVPQEMISLCQEMGKRGRIIAIEPDPKALEDAIKDTPQKGTEKNQFVEVEYIQGFGEDLDEVLRGRIPPQGAHSASLHDAIHEIPGRDTKWKIAQAVYRNLRPGGFFSINSEFTTTGMEGAAMIYGRWRRRTMVDVLRGSTRGETRDSTGIYSPDHYINLLEHVNDKNNPLPPEIEGKLENMQGHDQKLEHGEEQGLVQEPGFVIWYREDRQPIEFSKKAINAISVYPRFVKGFLEGFVPPTGEEEPDLPTKSRALIQARKLNNLETLPRKCFEVIAQKPLAKAA